MCALYCILYLNKKIKRKNGQSPTRHCMSMMPGTVGVVYLGQERNTPKLDNSLKMAEQKKTSVTSLRVLNRRRSHSSREPTIEITFFSYTVSALSHPSVESDKTLLDGKIQPAKCS